MIIVCSQPRSGSSMLMRILQSGGVDIEVDTARDGEERKKEYRNPYGMFETMRPTKTKCFKCFDPGVVKDLKAKFIYADRSSDGIMASWKSVNAKRQMTIEMIERQKASWNKFFGSREHIVINYDRINTDTRKEVQRIADFIDEPFDVEEAIKAVDTKLYVVR